MVNKLRKTPSGMSLPPGGGAPLAHAQVDKREKPPRSRSFSDALGGLKLRAAATQVHESISNLRRSGSTRLKSALKHRHSAPAALEQPMPAMPVTPTIAELPGSPPLRAAPPGRTPPPPDAAGMLRADLQAAHFLQIAKNPFDAAWLARQREQAVRFNDGDALKQQLAWLDGLHLDAIHRAGDLRERFSRLPLATETLAAIEHTEITIAQQLMAEKLAVMAARKRLRKPPPVPPRPHVHELP